MPELSLLTLLQVAVALGLWNVWLLRRSRETSYRGGTARTLREEFAAYGLPAWFFHLVGALKIGSGLALLVGLWLPSVTLVAASIVALLMLGALGMHARVHDPMTKSVPALAMLLMSVSILGVSMA